MTYEQEVSLSPVMGHGHLGSIVWRAVTHFGELHCVDLVMYDRGNKETGLLPVDPRGCLVHLHWVLEATAGSEISLELPCLMR